MTEKLISCPACGSDNLDNAVYCCQCGLPMREGIPFKYRKSQWVSILLLSLLLSILMTAGFEFFYSGRKARLSEETQTHSDPASPGILPQTAPPIPESADNRQNNIAPADRLLPGVNGSPAQEPPVVGRVEIFSAEGNLITEIPATVIGGSWLALPARSCIGGRSWLFRSGRDETVAIEEGFWDFGNAVGFWRLADGKEYPGPALGTWEEEKPVRLLLFSSGEFTEEMNLAMEKPEGIFVYSHLSEPMGPGIFLQDNRAVGWAFGDMLEGAYMWALNSDIDFIPETTVEDFYNDTFAGGREDFLSRALAIGSDIPPLVQLQMFTEAFWFPPKLSPENTPPHLRPETVYPYIVQLVDNIMNQELYNDIAQLDDEPLLHELRNPELLMNVARAIQKTYGTEAAVNFIEGSGSEILSMTAAVPHLDRLHVDLYLEWINSLLENNDTTRGWQVFSRARERFGDSLDIHLLGVELALTDGDWALAETLLYQKKYPLALRDKMLLLANRISTLKGQENQIIINFQPGSKEIPVRATLNTVLTHDFLIDTGSSFVTVPYSTVQFLGLEGRISRQQHEVQTASGIIYANVVILPSIEVQGWVVNDVQALIIDLPNRPGVGLLGLNFLDRFRMDLQTDNGILILEPR
ncbi:MAG: retropepsin-like aspartic protease [Desulfobulbaceae bacterium]|nr:retropepsin-like aspartic protease [Desulfobulbaceae bacterium]